ncbi:MAG: hypothetical protein QXP98_10545 [Thermoproteus sp.]
MVVVVVVELVEVVEGVVEDGTLVVEELVVVDDVREGVEVVAEGADGGLMA